jgi:hypothetical protein
MKKTKNQEGMSIVGKAKRILAFCLTLILLLQLMPIFTLPVMASNTVDVSTEAQLIAELRASSGRTIRLQNDITLDNNWSPINNFSGTLDGNGFTIRGLQINETNDNLPNHAGLFRTVRGATIINLRVELTGFGINKTWSGTPRDPTAAGVLIGKSEGTVIIDNVSVVGGNVRTMVNRTTLRSQSFAGGFIGEIAGGDVTIRNSHASSSVSPSISSGTNGGGHVAAGGMVGAISQNATVKIHNSYVGNNSIDIFANSTGRTATAYAGGFIGYVYTGSGTDNRNRCTTSAASRREIVNSYVNLPANLIRINSVPNTQYRRDFVGSGEFTTTNININAITNNNTHMRGAMTPGQRPSGWSDSVWEINLGKNDGFPTLRVPSRLYGHSDVITATPYGEVIVSGWAFDRADLGSSTEIHVYIGGPTGSGAEHRVLLANGWRDDVGRAFVHYNVGNNRGYSATITTEIREDNVPVFVYMRQAVHPHDIILLGDGNVYIPPTADRVSVNPASVSVGRGEQRQFSATVTGRGAPLSQNVTWTVEGRNLNSTTSIDANGMLAIGATETGIQTVTGTAPNRRYQNTLTVRATSTVPIYPTNTATVTIPPSPILSAISGPTSIASGATGRYSAIVSGLGVHDDQRGVHWVVEGSNPFPGTPPELRTRIDAHGELTISSRERATNLTVRVTSTSEQFSPLTTTFNVNVPSVFPAGDGESPATAFEVPTFEHLDSVRHFPGAYFRQTANIDMSGHNWNPIGTETAPFRGTFNGNNYTITGLNIDRLNATHVGLFGHVAHDGTIENLSLEDATIIGGRYVGGIAGVLRGEIINSYSIGGVVSNNSEGARYASVGGLVGAIYGSGSIERSFYSGAVRANPDSGSARAFAGGLAGQVINNGGQEEATIARSYANGSVIANISGRDFAITVAGGLVGRYRARLTISDSYSTNNRVLAVSYSGGVGSAEGIGVAFAGGLIGKNDNVNDNQTGSVFSSTIINSYSTNFIDAGAGGFNLARTFTGGLIGCETNGVSVEDSDGILTITGYTKQAITRAIVENSYRLSTQIFRVGSALGPNYLDEINNIGINERTTVGIPLNEAQMKDEATFVPAWNFNNIWFVDPDVNGGFPILRGLRGPGNDTFRGVSALSIENGAEVDILMNETLLLIAAVLPHNASDRSVIWETDNPAVATVGGNGRVHARGIGSAVITATSVANENLTASIVVNVFPPVAAPKARLLSAEDASTLVIELYVECDDEQCDGSCPVCTAEIFYNLDALSSVPDRTGTRYTVPISIDTTTYVQARAFATFGTFVGGSRPAGFLYTVLKSATPTASWRIGNETFECNGDCCAVAPHVLPFGTIISFTGATHGSTLRHTISRAEGDAAPGDPGEVTLDSPILSALRLDRSVSINAQALHPTRFDSSTVRFNFQAKVDAPMFFPGHGADVLFNAPVIIASGTPGAIIRYTTNGSEPNESSPIYASPINVTMDTTIRARAFLNGCVSSDVASATFTVSEPPPIESDTSSYAAVASGSEIRLSADAESRNLYNMVIRYTTNGSEPTSNSPLAWHYAIGGGGVSMPIAITDSTIINARFFGTECNTAIGVSREFVFDNIVTASPFADPPSGSNIGIDFGQSPPRSFEAIVLDSITDGAEIWYTLDGTPPQSSNTRELFDESDPIYFFEKNLNANILLRAIAYRPGLGWSNEVSFIYHVVETMGRPVVVSQSAVFIDFGTQIALSTETTTQNAEIRFTTDGTPPTENSQLYTEPIAVHFPKTIRAQVFGPDLAPGPELEVSYDIKPQEIMLHIGGVEARLLPELSRSRYINDKYSVNPVEIPAWLFVYENGRAHVVLSVAGDGRTISRDYARGIVEEAMADIEALRAAGEIVGKVSDVFEIFKIIAEVSKASTDIVEALGNISTDIGIAGDIITFSASLANLLRGGQDHRHQIYFGWAEGDIDEHGNITNLFGEMHYTLNSFSSATPRWIDWYTMGTSAAKTGLAFTPLAPFSILVPSIEGKDTAEHYVNFGGSNDTGEIEINFSAGRIMPRYNNHPIYAHADFDSYRAGSAIFGAFGHRRQELLNLNTNMNRTTYSLDGQFTINSTTTVFWIPIRSTSRTPLTRSGNLTGPSPTGRIAAFGGDFIGIQSSSTPAAPDISGFEFTSRDNWSQQTLWPDVQSLQIGSETAPLLVETANDRVMFFLADNGSRNDANRVVLMYSVYMGDAWSEPLPVYDNGTNDFYPHAASDGQNIWVTWLNSNRDFDNTPTLETMLESVEVYVAQFNNATGTFINVAPLTDNNTLDTQPRIAVNGNEVFVSWLQNTENCIFGITGINRIMSRTKVNGVWGSATELSSYAMPIVDKDVAWFEGQARVAYIVDGDGNLDTFDDRTLRLSGSSVPITNTTMVANPRFATIHGQPSLTWFEVQDESANIRYMNAGQQPQTLLADANLPGNYKIIGNGDRTAIIYAFVEDQVGSIVVMEYIGGAWSKPVKLTDTSDFALHYNAIFDGDNYYIVYNASRTSFFGEGDDATLIETNDIRTLNKALTPEIVLIDMFSQYEAVEPGNPVPVSAFILNISTVPLRVSDIVIEAKNGTGTSERINNFTVKVEENGEWIVYSGELSQGVLALVEFDVTMPTEQVSYVVSIGAEGNESDANNRTIILGQPNFMLSLQQNAVNDAVVVTATVTNQSYIAADANLIVRRDARDGEILNIVDLGELVAGRESATTDFYVVPGAFVSEDEDSAFLFFEVTGSRQEVFITNASDFVIINAPKEVFGISLNPDSVKFLPAVRGYTSPPTERITINNAGNRPTGILNISLSGEDANSFVLSETTINNMGVGQVTSFAITPVIGLTPGASNAPRTYTATVTVSGDNIAPQSVEINFTVGELIARAIFVTSSDGGTAQANIPFATQGMQITLSAQANSGYQFKKWEVVSGNIVLSEETDNPAIFQMVNEFVEVIAIFELSGERHNVIFNLNGGNFDGETDDVEIVIINGHFVGTEFDDDTLPEPEREDFIFTGWRYSGQVTGTQNLTGLQVAQMVIEGDITFTAQWQSDDEHCAHEWDSGTPESGKVCGETAIIIYSCTACGETKTEPEAVIQHSYGNWTFNNDATCLIDGTETRSCTRLNCPNPTETQTAAGTALSHTWVMNGNGTHNCTTADGCGAINQACNPTGNVGDECDKCKYITPDPACLHANTTKSIYTEPTCTTDGKENVTCNDCGGIISSLPIPATGHIPKVENCTECENCGVTLDKTCNICEVCSPVIGCGDCGTCVVCNPPYICADKCACLDCVCDCVNKTCHDCDICNVCNPTGGCDVCHEVNCICPLPPIPCEDCNKAECECPVPSQTPVIATQPTGATYNRNATVNPLTVVASVTDGGTLSYQWYSNTTNSNSGGTAIEGATGASFTPPTSTAGTVYYYVIVTNTNGENEPAYITSNAVAIIVNASTGGNTSGGSGGGGGGGGSIPVDVPITPTATITAGTSTWTVTSIPRTALTALGLSVNIPVNQLRVPTGATGNISVNVGAGENYAGQNAILVMFNAVTNELEFVSASAVGANGSVNINVTQAGDFLVLTFKTGDITGTGEVQTTDALALLRHVAGIEPLNSVQLFVANGKQGDTGTNDALNILRYVAGIIDRI